MATELSPITLPSPTTAIDECNKVFDEYLELFDCLGYRYKYFMAPNAQLDWFGISQVRTPLRIQQFLLEKFGSKRRHANFSKAISCEPIESTSSHMRTRHLPSKEANLIHPKNVVPELSSLKLRAESDVEDGDTVMATPHAVETATSSNVEKTTETAANSSGDESEDYNARRCKRMKYSTSTPFTYLRRLPTKKTPTIVASSDDDTSDDDSDAETAINRRQKSIYNEYSQLHYLEAVGTILKNKPRHLGGGCTVRPIRLRIAYRKHLIDQTPQFALIIYEHRDQNVRARHTIRSALHFSFSDSDEQTTAVRDNEEAQPAVAIRSNEDGEERAIAATVETPHTNEIGTALEEAAFSAFSVQPPVHRTPTKMTPIPPGTPKRRPRSSQLNMSGLAPLPMTSAKKSNSASTTTPKLSAARSLRL